MKHYGAAIMILVLAAVGYGYALEPGEASKIQYLITSVETLEGAKFIRNGGEHDAKAAAAHLRLKLKVAGAKVKTADDFIRICASKSSLSGEPYRIRFSDGTTVEAGVFFRNKLKAFTDRVSQ